MESLLAGVILLLILLFTIVSEVEAIVPTQLSRGLSRDELIKEYFLEGYEYRLIICFLYFVHGLTLSLRQLKRVLRAMDLHRRVRPRFNHVMVRTLIRVSKIDI